MTDQESTVAGDPHGQLHRAARLEDAVRSRMRGRVHGRGWRAQVTGYTGYGHEDGWVRVFARVLMTRPGRDEGTPFELRRGWRSFVTIPVSGIEVHIQAGSRSYTATTDRGGYLDVRLDTDLAAGWQTVTLSLSGEGVNPTPVQAPVNIVRQDTRLGVVSDVDDTVMITTLPRALLAAWNTFVLNENARRQVTGMSVLYERLARLHPESPFVYLSTGAWNVAPTLTRFLSRNLYPTGPLLLTDWGPTQNGWFRSGQAHKKRSLKRLAEEFPQVKWLLIGDDGQHDPVIYNEFARSHPEAVAAVAIRHLSPSEQVLASGLPVPMDEAKTVPGTPWVSAPDGAGLWRQLRELEPFKGPLPAADSAAG